jgi:PAS domain S-box-containing protein
MDNSSDRQAQTELAMQQQAQAKLQANEQLLYSIYYGSANGIFVVDVLPSGEFRFAGLNPAHERLTGLRSEDIKGKSPEQVLPAAAAAAVSANYARCVQAGTSISYEECLPFRGEESWWLTTLTPLFDVQSRIYQLTGTSINITVRKQVEEQLRRQKEFLYNVIDTNPNLIWVKDWDGRFRLVNKALAEIYGTTIEDLTGKLDADFNPVEAEVEHYLHDDRQVMTSLQPKFIAEETLTSATGEVHWLQTIKKPLLSPDGEARYVLAVATDITDRKRAEQERDREAAEKQRLFQQIEQQNQTLEAQVQQRTAQLRQTNEQLWVEIRERQRLTAQLEQQAKTLDTVLSASPDEFYMFDRAGRYLYANRCALQAMSVFLQRQEPLELSDIIGFTGRDLGFPLELVEPHEARLEGVFVTGEALRGEMSYQRQNDIRHQDYIITPLYDQDGGVERVIVTSSDISDAYRQATQRKQAELALEESKQHITNILETITDAFFALNQEWQFTYLNRQAERLLDRNREQLLGKNLWDEFPEAMNSNFYREFHQVISDRVRVTFEEFYPPLNRWFEVRAYPAPDGLGVYFRNITKRKQAEDKIKASLIEKETLLKEIHHRVKNNLQIISSLLRLQSRQIQDIHSLELFKESQNRVQAMALIHEKLYQSSNLAQIDFLEYIRTLVNDLFRSYGIHRQGITFKVNVNSLETDLANISTTGQITYNPNPPLLAIDTAIPCGLMINELVSNSLKYAFPNNRSGEIFISLQFGGLALSTPVDEYQFILIIRDNGVGFPEDLDFRNTKSLGLQLVCRLTKQIGGSIELNRSQGTEFRIVFANPIYQ